MSLDAELSLPRFNRAEFSLLFGVLEPGRNQYLHHWALKISNPIETDAVGIGPGHRSSVHRE